MQTKSVTKNGMEVGMGNQKSKNAKNTDTKGKNEGKKTEDEKHI